MYPFRDSTGADTISDNMLTTFVVPNNAVINDQKIITEQSMIIGNHSIIERDLKTGFLMIGEGVHISGEVYSDNDIRADVWCKFEKNITANGNAYIGEFTVINGKIVVEGDLDIGKEVKLNGGFLSKGWVVVRNPLPVMVFIFIYIRALMGLGKSSEEIDKALNEMFEDDEEIDFENLDESKISEILNRGDFFVIPLGSKISSESVNVPENITVGQNCTIQTRLICKNFEGGKNLVFDGTLRSKGETIIADDSKITGELISSGKLIIGKNVKIDGTVSAKSVIIHDTSFVEGEISSSNIRFAVGENFDVKDPKNTENAQILSKADSFEKMKTNVIEKAEEPEDEAIEEIIEETDETAEEAVEEISVKAEDASKIEAEPTESENESAAPAEIKKPGRKPKQDPAEPAKSDESTPDAALSRRAKRRRTKKANTSKNMPIVDVFSGEDIEKTDDEKNKTNEKEKKQ